MSHHSAFGAYSLSKKQAHDLSMMSNKCFGVQIGSKKPKKGTWTCESLVKCGLTKRELDEARMRITLSSDPQDKIIVRMLNLLGFLVVCLIVTLMLLGCTAKPNNPEPAADLPPNKSICEMGFGCELIIDSNGVKYGRPL